jgi:hypothetical protein
MLRVPLSYQADDVDGLAARRDQRDMLILYRENVIDYIVVLNKKFYHMSMQRRGKVTPVAPIGGSQATITTYDGSPSLLKKTPCIEKHSPSGRE